MIARLLGLRTISPRALEARLGEVTVVDVNAPASWFAARVPGARSLDPDAFATGDLPAAKDATLVFYCSNPLCRKAPRAAKRALAMGYRDVLVLSAGIKGWKGAGFATESGGQGR